MHQAVECVEEGGAIPLRQCGWAARIDAGLAQVLLESSASQGPANVIDGPFLPVEGEGSGTASQAASGERYVSGRTDIGCADPFDNPVIRRVRAS